MALGAHIAEEDCAEKIIYALGSCQGSACDVMLVGEGDLPRSGASRRIRGRAYADLNGTLAAIVRGRCSAPVGRDGAGNQPCGLQGWMIQIRIA